MKFFGYVVTCILLVSANPVRAEEDVIVVTGDVATTAEVTVIRPGVADITMGPLYGVFLDTVPEGVNPHMRSADDSGHGTAAVAKWRNTPYTDARICWKEVGPHWTDTPHCGERHGSMSVAEVNLGSRRSEVFALVPVALDSSGHELAWIAHPENTRVNLSCGNMASIFAIDALGNITIANEAERLAYQRERHC